MAEKDQFVRCHICPMQEMCDSAEPDESYKRVQHLRNPIAPDIFDLEKLAKAKENCPMRKKLRS